MSEKKYVRNTLLWGFILWLVGYIAGFILFFVVPKEYIGWIITPLATIFTIWVINKKIKRSSLNQYILVGLMWTIIAIIFDYLFITKLLNIGTAYYKPDVVLYYFLTFTLPIMVGYWKLKHKAV